MSAINQMLRDLDARTHTVSLAPAVGVLQPQTAPERMPRRVGLGVAIIFSAALVGGLASRDIERPPVTLSSVELPHTPKVARQEIAEIPVVAPVTRLDVGDVQPTAPVRTVLATARPLPERAPHVVARRVETLGGAPIPAEPRPATPIERASQPVEKTLVTGTQEWLAQARQARQNGDIEGAIRILREAYQASHDAPLSLALGKQLAEAGQPIEALAALRQGQSAARAGDYGLMASLLAQLGRHDEAVPAYRQALSQDASRGGWWLGLGVSLEATGQAEGARDAFMQARQQGQFNPDVMQFLNQRLSR